MIAIVNTGPESQKPTGWRTYEVRINRKVICTFRHKREESLEICLQKAAKAVMLAKSRQLETMFNKIIPE